MPNYDYEESHYESVSPDRPPQFNEAICGRGCGCDCSRAREGDDGDDGDTTLVASDSFDVNDDLQYSEDDEGTQQAPDTGDAVDASTAQRTEDVSLNQQVIEALLSACPCRGSPFQAHNAEEVAGSMWNEGCGSDDHSTPTSEGRSFRAMSPGPGIGAWMEDGPLEHHFLARPLRLSHRLSDCRGLIASHLVMHDEATLLELQDED